MEGMNQQINLMTSRRSHSTGELVAPSPLPPSFVPPPPSIDRGTIFPSSCHATPVAIPSSNPIPYPSPSLFSTSHSIPDAFGNLVLHSPSDFCPVPSPASKPSGATSIPFLDSKIIVGGMQINKVQLAVWNGKFDDARLRKHQWEWPTSTITAIWDEWASGLNGFLAVRDLEERWGARWRRNNSGQKTEMGRRKKVIQLIEKLAAKPNWNLALALRFILTMEIGRPEISVNTFRKVRWRVGLLQSTTSFLHPIPSSRVVQLMEFLPFIGIILRDDRDNAPPLRQIYWLGPYQVARTLAARIDQ
ncbi:hypothetical protein B0H17DRAFT_1142560 [Mycena rosella]|uniref:Transcription activator GCR1-like domain-containing protein n=1 Tax=Mycena rosella TaxID=1033263 RepID=A0AAD7G998_MYCRO|nr:hypothetical protein B0H17DRAFT_1142560 [Mycena rosella]